MRSNDSQKVIVVGIPKSMDDAGLSELFSGFGTVAEAKVVLDAATSASRGFGFVTFTAGSAMRAAIKAMDKKKVDGRVLNVRQLVPKDKFQQRQQQQQGGAADPSKRPCWLLRKGKCTKGDSCPFSHETQGGDFGSCFEFVQTGACKRGDKCKFYHPPASESAEAEGESGDQAEARAEKKQKKGSAAGGEATSGDKPAKRVCYAFQSGRCHRGKKCMFAHEKLPTDAAPESKQDEKKKKEEKSKAAAAAAAVKRAGGFEVVAGDAGDTGRKRKREETESADDGSDDDDMELQEPQRQSQKPQKQSQEPQKPQRQSQKQQQETAKGKKGTAAPLAGLAAHVSSFMTQQAAAARNKPSDAPERRRGGPPASAKRQKTEPIDMGAAFDSDSDDARARRRRPAMDAAARKAAREQAKQERRAKRSAKKQALSRLRTEGEVDLGTGA